MTPRALAEKIARKLADAHSELLDKYEVHCSADMFDEMYQVSKKELESLLSEAINERDAFWEKRLAEAFDSGFIGGKDAATPIHCCVSDVCDLLPEKLKEARAAAYEEAAKIAESCQCPHVDECCWHGGNIAKEIRLRAGELKA